MLCAFASLGFLLMWHQSSNIFLSYVTPHQIVWIRLECLTSWPSDNQLLFGPTTLSPSNAFIQQKRYRWPWFTAEVLWIMVRAYSYFEPLFSILCLVRVSLWQQNFQHKMTTPEAPSSNFFRENDVKWLILHQDFNTSPFLCDPTWSWQRYPIQWRLTWWCLSDQTCISLKMHFHMLR